MSGRPKTTVGDAKRTTIHLNPDVDFALNFIENSRRMRKEKRYQQSDIIADAVWFYVENVEKRKREDLLALLPKNPDDKTVDNVTTFPRPKKS